MDLGNKRVIFLRRIPFATLAPKCKCTTAVSILHGSARFLVIFRVAYDDGFQLFSCRLYSYNFLPSEKARSHEYTSMMACRHGRMRLSVIPLVRPLLHFHHHSIGVFLFSISIPKTASDPHL
jgi:hypothetical protein